MKTNIVGAIDNGGTVMEQHAPELYQPGAHAAPVPTLEDIGPDEVEFYRVNGYLAVERAFTPDEVEEAMAGMRHLILGGNADFKDIFFEAAFASRLDELGPEERLDAVRKLQYFVEFEPRLKALSAHPKLARVVKLLLGSPEPELYADQAMIKPPRIGREKPWHQDMAFFDFDPSAVPVVGVWVALDEVGVDNGCMQVLPGRHREGPIPHFQKRDWQICDTDIMGRQSVAVPLPPGGLLLFDGLLPHGTPHNASSKRRRALQFHYIPAGSPRADDETRLKMRRQNFDGYEQGIIC